MVNNDMRHTMGLILTSFLLDTYHSFSYIDLLHCWDILTEKYGEHNINNIREWRLHDGITD